MFMLLVALPALLTVWALGGRLSSALEYRWRALWLIWLGLAGQIVLFTPLGNWLPDAVVPYAHVGTYLPLIAFLGLNRGAGLSLAAVGMGLNLVAITANGGFMPADETAQQVFFAGRAASDHALNTDNVDPHFLFLGDVMATPSWFPLANAFSIGDLVLAVGLVWAMSRLSLGNRAGGRLSLRSAAPTAAPFLAWMVLAVGLATPGAAVGPVGAVLGVFALCGTLLGRTAWMAGRKGWWICAGLLMGAAGLVGLSAAAAAIVTAIAAAVLHSSCAVSARPEPRDRAALTAAAGLASGVLGAWLLTPWVMLAVPAVLVAAAAVRGVPAVDGRVAPAAARRRSRAGRLAVAGVAASAGLVAANGSRLLDGLGVPDGAAMPALLAAVSVGHMFGLWMARRLGLERNTPALGLACLFAAASLTLFGTAFLAMTAVAALVVAGMAFGAGAVVSGVRLAGDDRLPIAAGFVAGLAIAVGIDPLSGATSVLAVAAALGAVGLGCLATRLRGLVSKPVVGAT